MSATNQPIAKKSALLKFLIRLFISAVFLVLIYRHVDFPELMKTLKTVSFSTAILLVSMYAAGQMLSALKWKIFINRAAVERKLSDVIRAYFFGMFINTFGLGTIGGDVARSLALQPRKGERAASLATVIADRIHGLTVLTAIGTVAIICIGPGQFRALAVIASCVAVCIFALSWWFGPKLLLRIFPPTHRYGKAASEVAMAFPSAPKPFWLATLISLVFHLSQITMHLVIARAIGANLSFAYLLATVPLVNVASALPISINGLGIREAMYLLLFSPMGISNETAVAFGAIWIVTVTVVSAIGGLIVAPTTKLSMELNSTADQEQKLKAAHESN